jgi:hypothetical protein
MEKLKTQKEIDDHIENHKVSLKSFEKTFGFKKKTITLPTFMWIRILNELSTSSVFCGRLSDDGTGFGIDKDMIEWDVELMMGIEQLQKKLK